MSNGRIVGSASCAKRPASR